MELARLADDDGWFGFWYADHYMPNTGDESFEPGDVHECWAILPAVAATTSRIRLGPLVSPTSVHHPALLANRAATIDHLSDGRMVLGLGAGWQINEHRAYGIELEAPATRVDRFEEAIEITRSLLDNERTTFAGTHYEITDAPSDPKPVQAKLPIVVGTSGPRMMRITATHAQEWNTWGAPDLAGGNFAKFATACDKVGTDIGSLHTSVQALVAMTEDAEKVAKLKAADMGPRTIAGSNDQLVEEIGRYVEIGFDEMIVPDFALGATTEQRLESFQRFKSEIATQFS